VAKVLEECSGGAATDEERAALQLWASLVRATDIVRASLSAELAPRCGLAPEDIELLTRLSEAPEQRLRMADVSRSLLLSKSGATRLIDRLAERGLVERAACPSDRRVVYASLTSGGREALREAGPALRAGLVAHLGRHLGAHEAEAVRAALDRILTGEGAGV
jgi:DNA-binding MarR family transcriptional regulator